MRQVVKVPNPILNDRCKEVTSWPLSKDILSVISEMKSIAKDQGALGIAANQVGAGVRIFYLKTRHLQGGMEEVFINPVIYKSAGYEVNSEGCLSFDNRLCMVGRAKVIRIKYKDTKGVENDITLTGLSARCVQHEVDHLNGISMDQREKETFEKLNGSKA